MNRAVTWRLNPPAVRYDYAPRGWDAPHRAHASEPGKRESVVPALRKLIRILAVVVLPLGLLTVGVSFRIRYLGDGTIRFERRPLWAQAAPAAPALTTLGALPARQASIESSPPSPVPSPGARSGAVDLVEAARKSAGEEACLKSRAELAEAVASYNEKYPDTQITSLSVISLAGADLPGKLEACPGHGSYSLTYSADQPSIRCSAHP